VIDSTCTLFGTANRSRVLIAVRLLEETWAREACELLSLRLFVVQTALKSLEAEGALVSRLVGRSRVFSLNPRYVVARELSALLWKLGGTDLQLQQKLATRRRRPRRAGKAL
jgi:DNA-binding transcriptional ArsR family regulator